MQLDIFEHSRDAMLRNDAVHAVERRAPAAAQAARQALAAACPDDDALAPLDVLIGAMNEDAAAGVAAFTDDAAGRAALSRAAHTLRGAVEPAALRLLGGPAGGVWPAPLWRRLAQRARSLAWRGTGRGAESADRHGDLAADAHAAPLWLLAGDWQAAAEAVSGIESWRRIPAPLAWMAEARCREHGLHDAWPLLVELAWLSPTRFDALGHRLRDPLLTRLRRAFDAAFDGDGTVDDVAWLPAWLLLEQPALAGRLALAEPSRRTAPELAMRLLLELLRLERQGRHHDLIDRRRALRDSHAGLYAAYMRTR